MTNIFNNLNQLYTFYLVASLGSFSKAAEKLCVTEPAISIQIRSLEQSIGFKLLERGPKHLSLTPKGRVVFEHAEKLAAIISDLSRFINQVSKIQAELLSIGSTKSLASKLLPKVLMVFLQNTRQVSLKLEENSSEELIKGLAEDKYDIVISGRVPYNKKVIAHINFGYDFIYPIAATDSLLLKKERVSLEDLAKEPLIVREKGSAARLATMNGISQKGFKPKLLVECGSTDLIKELVKQKKGFSFLPNFCIAEEIEKKEISIIPIPDLILTLYIDVFYSKNKELSSITQDFLLFLKKIRKPLLMDTMVELDNIISKRKSYSKDRNNENTPYDIP